MTQLGTDTKKINTTVLDGKSSMSLNGLADKQYTDFATEFAVMFEKLNGKPYIWTSNNYPMLLRLAKYFVDGDNPKNIALSGAVGSGKSSVMRAISEVLKGTDHFFSIISATDIVRQYNREKDNVFYELLNKRGILGRRYNYCIDDVGDEPLAEYTRLNVIDELIKEYYRKWSEGLEQFGGRLHITSNIVDKEGWKGKYSDRAVDRMSEMYDGILSKDKSWR